MKFNDETKDSFFTAPVAKELEPKLDMIVALDVSTINGTPSDFQHVHLTRYMSGVLTVLHHTDSVDETVQELLGKLFSYVAFMARYSEEGSDELAVGFIDMSKDILIDSMDKLNELEKPGPEVKLINDAIGVMGDRISIIETKGIDVKNHLDKEVICNVMQKTSLATSLMLLALQLYNEADQDLTDLGL